MNGGHPWLVLVLVIVGLVVAGLIIWGILRARYVASLRKKGWAFDSSPDISIVHGLNNPPFGIGFDRKVDDRITGITSSGVPFQAFEYSSSLSSSEGGYIVTMPLPRSMPEFRTSPGQIRRPAVNASEMGVIGDMRLYGHEASYVQAVGQALEPAARMMAAVAPPELSVDHRSLVAMGAPKKADELQRYVEAMAQGALALSSDHFARWVGEEPPPELSFYQRPDWSFRTRDDAMLAQIEHTRAGSGHTARNVMFTRSGAITIVALTHQWITTRTVTEPDGNGGTRTRTVTDHHSEDLREFHPAFPFAEFKVNAGWFGNKRTFESIDFNQRFTVRTPDARFAHDIFHPRMMEWMLQVNPPPFEYENGRIHLNCEHTIASMEAGRSFLTDFFSRVPRYVWQNLGMATPPIPLETASGGGETSSVAQVDQSGR